MIIYYCKRIFVNKEWDLNEKNDKLKNIIEKKIFSKTIQIVKACN